jgi:hypothetical protein
MDTKIPRDIEGHPFFPRLAKAFGGRAAASFVSLRLWCELGYQVEIHGKSGVMDFHEVPAFCDSVVDGLEPLGQKLTPELVIAALTDARLLEPHGEHYFCQIFARMNPDLDLKAAEGSRNRHFMLISKAAGKMAQKVVPRLEGHLWDKGDGTRFTAAEMNEAVLLIKTIDRIMHLKPERRPGEFDTALIQDAHRIVTGTSANQLTAVLKRYYKCRSLAGLPRTTPLVLKEWDDVLAKITPEDGWGLWAKKENLSV